MFRFFKRNALIKRGLSTRKTRRRRSTSELTHKLEHSPFAKALIFAGFVLGLALLVFNGQQSEPTKTFVVALLFFAAAVIQLWINQPKTFVRSSRLLLVFGIIFVQLGATKLILLFSQSNTLPGLRPETAALLVPYAFAPMVLSVLLGRNHGLYAAIFVSLWTRLLFGNAEAPLFACALISGFVAVYLTLQVRRRSRLIRAGLGVGLVLWLLAVTFGLIGPIDLFTPLVKRSEPPKS
jgi:membrane-associated HD superfamily phosphohydrolase